LPGLSPQVGFTRLAGGASVETLPTCVTLMRRNSGKPEFRCHPRLCRIKKDKAWMPGIKLGMTSHSSTERRSWLPPKRSPAGAGLKVSRVWGLRSAPPQPLRLPRSLQVAYSGKLLRPKVGKSAAAAKFKFGRNGLNPSGTRSTNQNNSGFLKDLAQGRRHTRRCEPADRSPRRAEVALFFYCEIAGIGRRDAGKRWRWIG
jgi:hypothetical protein